MTDKERIFKNYERRSVSGGSGKDETKTIQIKCHSCGAPVTGYIAYNGHLHYKCDACGCSLIA